MLDRSQPSCRARSETGAGVIEAHSSARVLDGAVTLDDGDVVEADAVVLATRAGQAPVTAAAHDDPTQTAASQKVRADELAQADSVVILGAGPVGLELAGEIRETHPHMVITVVDPSPELLAATTPGFARRVGRQLDRLRIAVLLGDRLGPGAPVEPTYLPGREFTTTAGARIPGEVVLIAHGTARGHGQVLPPHARTDRDQARVDDHLLVHGHTRVFAVGDLTDLAEPKLAITASRHAKVVAANVLDVLAGRLPSASWTPMPRPPMLLPLGSRLGAGLLPVPGRPVVGPWLVSQIKGRTLILPRIHRQLRAPAPQLRRAPSSGSPLPPTPPAFPRRRFRRRCGRRRPGAPRRG